MELPTERLLRMLVAIEEPVEQYAKELTGVGVTKAKASRLGLRRDKGAWRPVRAAQASSRRS